MPTPVFGSSRARMLVWLAIPLVAAGIVGGVIAVVWEGRIIASLQAELATRTRESAQLLRRVDELRRAQAAPPLEAPPAPVVHVPPPTTDAAGARALALSEQNAQQLRESVTRSRAEVSQLQTKVADLESSIESASDDNQRLSRELEEGRRNLADTTQTLDTLRAQVKANAGQVTELETTNTKLRQQAAAGNQSVVQTQQTVSDLESVFRRRETYLNNILRRYKEITEQYRAMSAVNNGRDRQPGAINGPEISRILNTIALAEEDLKQIYALNAQAQSLQKKLPVK